MAIRRRRLYSLLLPDVLLSSQNPLLKAMCSELTLIPSFLKNPNDVIGYASREGTLESASSRIERTNDSSRSRTRLSPTSTSMGSSKRRFFEPWNLRDILVFEEGT